MKQKNKGGKQKTKPPGPEPVQQEPVAKLIRMDTVEAIRLLEKKIEFLDLNFSDSEKSMQYCAALIMAVAAMKREAGL